MPEKLLTSIESRNMETAAVAATMMQQTIRMQALEETVRETTKTINMAKTLPTLNVQRLMFEMKVIELMRYAPYIEQMQRQQTLTKLRSPLLPEEELKRKRLLPTHKIEALRQARYGVLRAAQIQEEITEKPLDPYAVLHTEQQVLAMLEKNLKLTQPQLQQQILQQIKQMCKAQQWFIPRIEGQEALQKLLLQQYVYAFMEKPRCVNMLGMMITAATMQALQHEQVVMYNVTSMLAEGLKTSALLCSAMDRKIATKVIAAQKPRTETVTTKTASAISSDLTDVEKLGMFQDLQGNNLWYIALRYAYGMPYYIRRWLAIQSGMPEYHKYALFFNIGAIPSRTALWGRKKLRYSPEQYKKLVRDNYTKAMLKYTNRRGVIYRSPILYDVRRTPPRY